jgi:hypothetical protein
MPKPAFSVMSYEGSILWRFFDCVSSAVSSRMLRGSPPGEENLTFLLCELLDESATTLHKLDYPLSMAKEELAKSDLGITLDVGFQTHEHPKYVESKYSGADLGIVLSMEHPILGYHRKAVLVQAKRLFAEARLEFTLYSKYSSYNKHQANFLEEIQKRFDAWNSIFYLWYNPPSTGFSKEVGKIIRAFEAHRSSLAPFWGRIHPFFDELMEVGFPFLKSGSTGNLVAQEEDNAREWRAGQPALRISALNTVLALTKSNNPPRLETFYEGFVKGSDLLSFAPFADFFLLVLLSPRCGNSSDAWVRLAQGQKVPMPPLKQSPKDQPPPLLDQLENPPIPRHTITFTVRSTLPNIG